MKIVIETIPIKQMRYPSCGDYWEDDDGVLQIRVAEMDKEFYMGMIAIHELFEFLLCRHKGIPEQSITDFDVKFEKKRKKGNIDEPGFHKKAPYRDQHTAATAVELIMCAMAGVSFSEYEKKINSL